MKFVVTGSAGNVSKPLTELLLAAGHEVNLVSRNEENIQKLVQLGATPAIGDMRDIPFLQKIFAGADGVYLMLPPMWDSEDQKQTSVEYANGFVKAIEGSNVKRAVFLSSYGADRLDDAGAISGMGRAEVVLNGLDGVDVLHLRAGYFYSNLLLSMDLIRKEGHMGNMFEVPAGHFTLVDPQDIAKAASTALTEQNFAGHSHRYIVSDESGTDEIAALIGKEIGIPDLKWVRFDKEDFRQVLLSYGFAKGAADSYVEMFEALDKGLLFQDYVASNAISSGTSIETFAKRFAEAYR